MVNTKKALQKLWKDKLTVTEYQEITKPNGATGFKEIIVLEDEPCKLSFSSLKQTDQHEENAAVVQATKVFCDNTLDIPAGSKLTIKRKVQSVYKTFEYSQSGQPGIFTNHQEIVLVPFKGWA